MGEENADNGAVLIKSADSSARLPTYSILSETFENSPVLFQDQTADNGSAFITIVRPVSNLKMRIEIWTDSPGYGFICYAESVNIRLKRFKDNDENLEDLGAVFDYSAQNFPLRSGPGGYIPTICDRTCVGTFKSFEDLKRAYPKPPSDVWARISSGDELEDVEEVYFTPVSNNKELVQWEKGRLQKWSAERNGPVAKVTCESKKYILELDFNDVKTGQKFALFYTAKIIKSNSLADCKFSLFSKITTRWESKAKPINIDAIRPSVLLSSLLSRIGDGKYNIIPRFSGHDSRLKDTYLLAGESIRNIPEARIYTSFNDFCDWMETVFGYVYTLGEPVKPEYDGIRKISGIEDDWHFDVGDVHGVLVDGYCPHDNYIEEPFFIRSQNCFCVWDNHATGNVYTRWKDARLYNDKNGKARKDVIFDDGRFYYVASEDDLTEFIGDAKAAGRISQPINFVHRNELFQNQEQGIVFTEVKEPQCKINTSMLYSIVEIGYEKQDYETECGRDEWNFMNCYNTGIDVTDKKLTLQSKYRADCYGLEFLAQERAKDTTDNKSDNNIFFVLTEYVKKEESASGEVSRGDSENEIVQETTSLKIARTAIIKGTLSDTVFNGEFSPYYCVKANEGYISAMAPNVVLQFTSSDGNSDIVIDGVKITADIPLSNRFFSEVELKFTSTDIEQTVDFSKLVKVHKNGLVYSGFLKQTECCYARPSETDYTIIVKSIEPL